MEAKITKEGVYRVLIIKPEDGEEANTIVELDGFYEPMIAIAKKDSRLQYPWLEIRKRIL